MAHASLKRLCSKRPRDPAAGGDSEVEAEPVERPIPRKVRRCRRSMRRCGLGAKTNLEARQAVLGIQQLRRQYRRSQTKK